MQRLRLVRHKGTQGRGKDWILFGLAVALFPMPAWAQQVKTEFLGIIKELFTMGQGVGVVYASWGMVKAGMKFQDEDEAHLAPKALKRSLWGAIAIFGAVGFIQWIKGKFGMQTF